MQLGLVVMHFSDLFNAAWNLRNYMYAFLFKASSHKFWQAFTLTKPILTFFSSKYCTSTSHTARDSLDWIIIAQRSLHNTTMSIVK